MDKINLTAKQAKEIALESLSYDFTHIQSAIGQAAEKGDFSVRINMNQRMEKSLNIILKNLRRAGYTVKRETGEDCRDADSHWDYLTVNWRE
jgi:hypothetical protein